MLSGCSEESASDSVVGAVLSGGGAVDPDVVGNPATLKWGCAMASGSEAEGRTGCEPDDASCGFKLAAETWETVGGRVAMLAGSENGRLWGVVCAGSGEAERETAAAVDKSRRTIMAIDMADPIETNELLGNLTASRFS